jgi:hypothetical protein
VVIIRLRRYMSKITKTRHSVPVRIHPCALDPLGRLLPPIFNRLLKSINSQVNQCNQCSTAHIQSVSQSINQQSIKPCSYSIINQPINQPTNQPTNHPTIHAHVNHAFYLLSPDSAYLLSTLHVFTYSVYNSQPHSLTTETNYSTAQHCTVQYSTVHLQSHLLEISPVDPPSV